ncbi:hypothetical protein ACGFRB_04240 [Streptomyces sp. NPDC048718]|uniref:hypothetical protein n=1 Tax=Streptomyces sp. NPDC048718 TaxID=3365587 RepID=UPI00371CDC14
MGLSSFASKPAEEVVAANPLTFFRMYWMGGKDSMITHGANACGRQPSPGAVGRTSHRLASGHCGERVELQRQGRLRLPGLSHSGASVRARLERDARVTVSQPLGHVRHGHAPGRQAEAKGPEPAADGPRRGRPPSSRPPSRQPALRLAPGAP